MQEDYTANLLKMFIEMLLVLLFLAIIFLGFQISKVNSFKQEVNYVIQRQGGLTTEALKDLKHISDNTYNGYFTVVEGMTTKSETDGQVDKSTRVASRNGVDWMPAMKQGQFGQLYSYKIHMKIPIPFQGVWASNNGSNPVPKYFEADFGGSEVSKVRK